MARPTPKIRMLRGPRRPRGLVVLLHGGPVMGRGEAKQWGLPYLRMLPFGWYAFRYSRGCAAVAWVRFARKGWNGAEETPVEETRHVLEAITRRAPHLPLAVIGHSMGGRAALRVAAHPSVRTVVALAPWVPEKENVGHLHGQSVLIMQGDRDLITPQSDADTYVERARQVGAHIAYVLIEGGGHFMVRHARRWHTLAARRAVEALGLRGVATLPRG